MSTIVVVKKGRESVIAADTLTTCGNTMESAEYVVNHEKIIAYKDSFLGFSGSASLQLAAQSFLSKTRKTFSLRDVAGIYEFGLILHAELKNKHFLRATTKKILKRFAVIC